MHPRNYYATHTTNYAELAEKDRDFSYYVRYNKNGSAYVDWSDSNATLELTRVLLKFDFGIQWSLPSGNLCPTVTSRLNYLHWVEDLLAELPASARGVTSDDPTTPVLGMDIGTGASCIYPLLGTKVCGFDFLATDIDTSSLQHAHSLLQRNPHLAAHITLIQQTQPECCLQGILYSNGSPVSRDAETPPTPTSTTTTTNTSTTADTTTVTPDFSPSMSLLTKRLDFTMCNPPFFADWSDKEPFHNKGFLSTDAESVAPALGKREAGEIGFIKTLINDSIVLRERVGWYTSLVGIKADLIVLQRYLQSLPERARPLCIRTGTLYQGRTLRWVLAWTYHEVKTTAEEPAVDDPE